MRESIKMNLKLKEGSWKNLFECIRDSKIESKGNFWAAIQSLEDQMEEKEIKPKEDKSFKEEILQQQKVLEDTYKKLKFK